MVLKTHRTGVAAEEPLPEFQNKGTSQGSNFFILKHYSERIFTTKNFFIIKFVAGYYAFKYILCKKNNRIHHFSFSNLLQKFVLDNIL